MLQGGAARRADASRDSSRLELGRCQFPGRAQQFFSNHHFVRRFERAQVGLVQWIAITQRILSATCPAARFNWRLSYFNLSSAQIPNNYVSWQHGADLAFDLKCLVRQLRITGAQDAIGPKDGLNAAQRDVQT